MAALVQHDDESSAHNLHRASTVQQHAGNAEEMQTLGAAQNGDMLINTGDRVFPIEWPVQEDTQQALPARGDNLVIQANSPPENGLHNPEDIQLPPSPSQSSTPSSSPDATIFNSKGTQKHARGLGANRYADPAELKIWLGPKFLQKSTLLSRRPTLLAVNTTIALTVLGVNLGALIFFPHLRSDAEDEGTLKSGDCSKVKTYSRLIHVGINVLSSALVAASNFSMQILVAPSRYTIHEAHKNKKWVQVGVPSVRNLIRIEWYRSMLWILMALSSLPLHFLYNSVVYSTVPTNNYMWAVVNNKFLDGESWDPVFATTEFIDRVNHTNFTVSSDNDKSIHTDFYTQPASVGYEDWDIKQKNDTFNSSRVALVRDLQQQLVEHPAWRSTSSNDTLPFHRLEKAECLLQYNRFLANNSHLFLVSSEADRHGSPLVFWGFEDLADGTDLTSYWMFERTNNFSYSAGSGFEYLFPGDTHEERLAEIRTAVTGWNVATYKIDYCIASQRSLDDDCVLAYSPPLLIAICTASAVKCAGLLLTAFISWKHKSSKGENNMKLLLTLGDALQSFLKSEDVYTRNRCTMDREDVVKKDSIWTEENPSPREWKIQKRKFRKGASKTRWASTLIIYSGNWLAAIVFTVISLSGVHSSGLPLSIKNLFLGTQALLTNIIFANYAQFFISMASLLINSLFTTLHVAVEWSRYAEKRQPLRVSHPKGLQKGTYFLSLPFKYSGPMLAFFVAMHWVASQSIAVINIKSRWDIPNLGANKTVSACYHNPGWVVLAVVLATIPVIGLGVAFFVGELSSKAPVVSTCSAAISAACHPKKADPEHVEKEEGEREEFWRLPVQWGVESECNGVYHCSLTTNADVTVTTFKEGDPCQ
ncbi:hypothetical protein Q7P37_007591 [Cladosporium fusiforme]